MYHGERLNSITHAVGAVFALAAAVVLVVLAALKGDPWKIVSFSVYGFCLFSLYLCSALYHSLRGRAKAVFQKLDHMAIYLLIAGTYTPFVLVSIRGDLGWALFAAEWSLALIGILLDTFVVQKKRILPVVIYAVMGWIALFAVQPLIQALSMAGFLWLLSGGLFYTVGIIFFALDKTEWHFHGIWHCFVLAGSIAHYVAVVLYVN